MSERLATEELEMQLKELEARKKELEAKRREEKKKMRSKGRGGLIVLCMILAILTIGLSVTLFFSIRQSLVKIDALESEITNLEDTLGRANLDINALEERCETTSQELSTAKSTVSTYKEKLSSANSTIKSLKSELATATSTISSLRTEVNALKKKLTETDPDDAEYSYSFNSVNSLMTAIQKNPNTYKNKQVKVVGSICYHWYDNSKLDLFDLKTTDEYIFDESYASAKRMFWEEDKYQRGELISVEFKKDALSSFLKDKDYIKLYGTVSIADGEIYLTNCDYELISSNK